LLDQFSIFGGDSNPDPIPAITFFGKKFVKVQLEQIAVLKVVMRKLFIFLMS